MRLAMTGATGLVGSRVAQLLAPRHTLHSLGRSDGFDLNEPDPRAFAKDLPDCDALLHLGARTDVDASEAERDQGPNGPTWIINVEGTRALAQATASRRIRLVLVSTDFVFPTAGPGPHAEGAPPAATAKDTNWYGWTKREAERAATQAHPHGAILRIAYPYRAHYEGRLDLARKILTAYAAGQGFPLFADQQFTPTFVDDLAPVLEALARSRQTGTFHFACAEPTTPYAFGEKLLAGAGLPGPPRSGSFDTYQARSQTPRPKRGGLSCERLSALGLRPPALDASLKAFLAQWRTRAQP